MQSWGRFCRRNPGSAADPELILPAPLQQTRRTARAARDGEAGRGSTSREEAPETSTLVPLQLRSPLARAGKGAQEPGAGKLCTALSPRQGTRSTPPARPLWTQPPYRRGLWSSRQRSERAHALSASSFLLPRPAHGRPHLRWELSRNPAAGPDGQGAQCRHRRASRAPLGGPTGDGPGPLGQPPLRSQQPGPRGSQGPAR